MRVRFFQVIFVVGFVIPLLTNEPEVPEATLIRVWKQSKAAAVHKMHTMNIWSMGMEFSPVILDKVFLIRTWKKKNPIVDLAEEEL